jgi:hypothetical protein
MLPARYRKEKPIREKFVSALIVCLHIKLHKLSFSTSSDAAVTRKPTYRIRVGVGLLFYTVQKNKCTKFWGYKLHGINIFSISEYQEIAMLTLPSTENYSLRTLCTLR